MNKFMQWLSDIQILSALIWAAAIVGCSMVSSKMAVSTILITAAGIHVIMMTKKVPSQSSTDQPTASKQS
ncbi:MAG: hypothetical protein KJP00_03615 [Bacteroidia bacterium]|nr:hypothetical protein [Bacteroidia bacterium]